MAVPSGSGGNVVKKFSVSPIDWDKWFSFTAKPDVAASSDSVFAPCRDDCACEESCEDQTDLETAIAEVSFEIAQCNRILAELLARLEGKQS